MYITGVLFSICLLYAAFNLIFNNTHQLKNYFLYILFVTLCAYNHHISALFAVVVSVLTFFYINKSQRLTFTTVCMCAIALYLPILSLTLTQLKLSSLSWLPKINPLEVLYFMRAFFGTGLVGIILMLLFGFSILISIFKLKTITQKQQFLFLCFSINYLIIHIYSVIVGSILQNSNLLFSGIALLVFVATFFKNSTSKKMGYISFLLTLLLSCQSIFKKQLFFKVHHHEYEMQVNATKQTIDDFKTTDVSVIYKGEPFFISYYLSKYKLPHQKYFNTQTCSAKQLIDYLKNQTSQYIIVGDVSPAQIKMIKQFYPYALNNIESFFYNVYVFTKFYNTEPIPKEFAFNYSTYDFKIYTDTVKPLQLYNDSIVYCVTAHAKEFPFHISLNMDKKPIYKEQYLVIDFCIRNDSLLSSKDVICAEIKNKQGQSLYYKSEKMIDQITLNHKQNHIFMDVFIGSDHKQWIHKNASINFYLQKSKRSSFEIVNVKLYSLDDHPNKWLVWR